MITFGGRVLNTYNPVIPVNQVNVYKGGSVEATSVSATSVSATSVEATSLSAIPVKPLLHGGAGMSEDKIKEQISEFLKEEPKELFAAVTNAGIKGTVIGGFLGPMAWPLSWALWIINGIFTAIYYFILFCILMFFVSVIQSGLNLVHAAIDGVLIPLKAVYNIKIAGARLFGFLGGPVGSLQRSKDSIGKTTFDLFLNFFKKMLA